MTTDEINNFFGDMDLFLMDLILKGKVPRDAKVLDVGCGEGRNGIYFIRNGYEYHGWDIDESKLRLIEYLTKTMDVSNAKFQKQDILSAPLENQFDLVICSRILHFAESKKSFDTMWQNVCSIVKPGGIIYVSMDSAVDNTLAKPIGDGRYEFPDTKVRFALTTNLFEEIKKGFEEIEPLRTLAHHNERAQSFFILRKC